MRNGGKEPMGILQDSSDIEFTFGDCIDEMYVSYRFPEKQFRLNRDKLIDYLSVEIRNIKSTENLDKAIKNIFWKKYGRSYWAEYTVTDPIAFKNRMEPQILRIFISSNGSDSNMSIGPTLYYIEFNIYPSNFELYCKFIGYEHT